jgi:endonuclease/exonuclease/phosphatase (EEP) superfamily protein YafD
MKLISYNLHNNNAAGDLRSLVDRHDPDVLCVQEADTDLLPVRIGDLELVQSTTDNRQGLAVYLRASRLDPRSTLLVPLEKSVHDRVMKPAQERMVTVRAHDAKHDREVMLSSFHAAPLTASNALRRQQISTAFAALQDLGSGLPSVLAGDFNYPLFQARLERHVGTFGYDVSRSDTSTYRRYGVLRGNYDFALSRGFAASAVESLPQQGSDHLPILVQATLQPRSSDLTGADVQRNQGIHLPGAFVPPASALPVRPWVRSRAATGKRRPVWRSRKAVRAGRRAPVRNHHILLP